jgi:hypothetical protein
LSEDAIDILERKCMMETVSQIIKRFCGGERRIPSEIACELNMPDCDGISLVHYFAVLDYHELIEMIATYGANINLKAKGTNLTPLIIAASRGFDKSIRCLINLGAQIMPDKRGNSNLIRQSKSQVFPER